MNKNQIREFVESHPELATMKQQSNRVYGRSMDVGCDSNMCKPYNMEDLVAHMGTLPIVSEYHEVRETELR